MGIYYLHLASEQICNAFSGHDPPSRNHWCKGSATTFQTKTVKQQNSKLISPVTNRDGHERNSEERHSCGAAFPMDRDAKMFFCTDWILQARLSPLSSQNDRVKWLSLVAHMAGMGVFGETSSWIKAHFSYSLIHPDVGRVHKQLPLRPPPIRHTLTGATVALTPQTQTAQWCLLDSVQVPM